MNGKAFRCQYNDEHIVRKTLTRAFWWIEKLGNTFIKEETFIAPNQNEGGEF